MKNKFSKVVVIIALCVLCTLTATVTWTIVAAEAPAQDPWKYDLNKDNSISIADVTALLDYLSNNCGHTLVVDPAIAPTCTESGKTEGSHCGSCGMVFTEQEDIPALGHTEEILPAVAPTCAESGLTEGKKCSVCGEILVAQEVVSATGQHTFVALDAVEPTCTETGLTSGFACSVCGQIMIPQETVPATGHTVAVEAGTPPTCTEAGTTDKEYCSVCGAVLQDHETIPATGHTYKTLPAVPATCTETGLTIGMGCENCDMIFVPQNETPALGHDYVDGVCSRCGTLKPSEGLEYTLNSDGQSYSVKNGTCTDSNVIIPDTYEGMPVTVIGTNSFNYKTNIVSVVLPWTITTVGEHAFYGCTNLQSINIGSNVESIGRYAFTECSNLQSINIGSNVKSVGAYAFYQCTNLTFTIEGNTTWTCVTSQGYDNNSPVSYNTGTKTYTITINSSANCVKYWVNRTKVSKYNDAGQLVCYIYASENTWTRT